MVVLALLDALAFVALWLVVHLPLAPFSRTPERRLNSRPRVQRPCELADVYAPFRLFPRPDMAATRIAPVAGQSTRRLLRMKPP